jgi:hypothetical protein
VAVTQLSQGWLQQQAAGDVLGGGLHVDTFTAERYRYSPHQKTRLFWMHAAVDFSSQRLPRFPGLLGPVS